MFPCPEVSSNKPFPAVLPWQNRAMILDIPGPPKTRTRVHSPRIYQMASFFLILSHLIVPPLLFLASTLGGSSCSTCLDEAVSVLLFEHNRLVLFRGTAHLDPLLSAGFST